MSLLRRYWRWRHVPRRHGILFSVTTPDGSTFIGDFHMSKLTQLGAVLALFAVDAANAHTPLPAGDVVWTLSGDAAVATLTPSATDPATATLVGGTAAGSVTVTATLGGGGFMKSDTFEFDGVVVAPPPAPEWGPAVAIDWTVTPITAPVAG